MTGKDKSGAPAGNVSCLLCGGFISVSGGDRARFIDHMSNEHDAKLDCHDILLATCVLDSREKMFLVKSTTTRLDTIGRGKPANYSESFMNKLTSSSSSVPSSSSVSSSVIPSVMKKPPQQKQPQRTITTRPPQRSRPPPSVVQRPVQPPRPRPKPQSSSAPASRAPVSGLLRGNSSISVSKVDMRRKCNMCQIELPNPKSLIDHMNRNHFNLPGGINIITDNSSSSSSSSASSLATFKNNLQRHITAAPSRSSSQAVPARISGAKVAARLQPVAVTPPRKPKTIELVTCHTCGKTIDKSKFQVHKLTHAQERKDMKTTVLKNSSIVLTKTYDTKEAVDPLELEEEVTNSDYECNICEKKLANEKALKLHRNAEHGENNTIDDDDHEEMKNQIGDLETSELLDNLVNFLQD